jgi:hypothetical protein
MKVFYFFALPLSRNFCQANFKNEQRTEAAKMEEKEVTHLLRNGIYTYEFCLIFELYLCYNNLQEIRFEDANERWAKLLDVCVSPDDYVLPVNVNRIFFYLSQRPLPIIQINWHASQRILFRPRKILRSTTVLSTRSV